MRKSLIRVAVGIIVFIVSLFVANAILNKGNTDMTANMSPASLPIVYMNVNDEYVNPLHGYTVPMEGNYLRGSITPLMANRSVAFKAKLYDAVIAKVAYEVRPLDMSRLIEDTEITDFTYSDNEINASITLKDLIDDDIEYMLIIKLITSSGDTIRYYARVINRAELSISDKVKFVRWFSDTTFKKAEASELKQYMESNSEGDNSSYGFVNIHSSFNQLTWGGLSPLVSTGKNLEILEIDPDYASIRLTYQVQMLNQVYNVIEYFRVQKGKDRMYLMDYKRTVNQLFDENKNVVVNGKILHGIIDETIKKVENENGSIYCFVQQKSLFEYNSTTNTLSKLFSFYDVENADERTRFAAHGIKPLEVDSAGNARFIVYGYMNRGAREGQVGVSLYYYDATLNTIEEELFIPYFRSYQVLSKEIENLAYISPRGYFYVLIDGAVISVDIKTRQWKVMQDSISETGFFSSEDQRLIAWQKGENIREYNEIQLYRLDNMNLSSVTCSSSDIVVPLGFMDSDLIYGLARKDEVTTDETGGTLIPFYSIKIQSESGTVLKEYKQPDVYVLEVVKKDNMLILSRISKDPETGEFYVIDNDQIMNNKTETYMKNRMSSVVTEDTETTYQTLIYKSPTSTSSLKLTNPLEVVYEGSRDINIKHEDTLTRYYVYSEGKIIRIYTESAAAVNAAQEVAGVVVDKRMSYVWQMGDRLSSTKLNIELEDAEKPDDDSSEIAAEPTDDETNVTSSISSYAECLDVMLKCDGIYKDTYAQLREKSVIDVLRDNLDANVLELSGCNLSAVLYYVSKGYPVMALKGSGQAILIVGYDAKNTIIYDPVLGGVSKMGMNDSERLFEENGNRFITYIK